MSNGILIVDDNVRIRELLRMLVETNTPFKVCGEAENGAEAIKMAKELRPDLVLLDLTMPGMSGTETALLLQMAKPRPKIILFTVHADGLNQELASIYGIECRHSALTALVAGLAVEGGVYNGSSEASATKAESLAALAPPDDYMALVVLRRPASASAAGVEP